MPVSRKNKCKRGRLESSSDMQPWFSAAKKRNRKRDKIAKHSRKKNRGK